MSQTINYYLEMTSNNQLRKKTKPQGLHIVEAEEKEYRFNRYLYHLVGEVWNWTDRYKFSDKQWQSYAESEDVKTFVAYIKGSIAGYYELQKHPKGHVQIVYFGLAPRFIGNGFGGYMLSHALTTAWSWKDTERVWLYTCNTDHPNALDNYKARGLRLFKTERKQQR